MPTLYVWFAVKVIGANSPSTMSPLQNQVNEYKIPAMPSKYKYKLYNIYENAMHYCIDGAIFSISHYKIVIDTFTDT